jgi:hypothetical protein
MTIQGNFPAITYSNRMISGPLAQSVEQRTFNPWVVGSIPTGPTSLDTPRNLQCVVEGFLSLIPLSLGFKLFTSPTCDCPDRGQGGNY